MDPVASFVDALGHPPFVFVLEAVAGAVDQDDQIVAEVGQCFHLEDEVDTREAAVVRFPTVPVAGVAADETAVAVVEDSARPLAAAGAEILEGISAAVAVAGCFLGRAEEGTVHVVEAIAVVDFLVFRASAEGSLGRGDIQEVVADYSGVAVDVPVVGFGFQTVSKFHHSLACCRRQRLSVSVLHPKVLKVVFCCERTKEQSSTPCYLPVLVLLMVWAASMVSLATVSRAVASTSRVRFPNPIRLVHVLPIDSRNPDWSCSVVN